MPSNPQDRIVVVLGTAMIAAAKARAEAEKRNVSALVADAVGAYLARPAGDGAALGDRSSENSPRSTSLLGGFSDDRPASDGARLEAEVRALLGAVRELLPDVRRVVENHDEAMDTLDQVAAEIGRRQGAALALEEVAAIADGRAPGG